MSQQAFDIDAMIHEVDIANAPSWSGAPLHFTIDYYTPADLAAAFERWCFLHGNLDSYHASRMWHPGGSTDARGTVSGHTLATFTADLRCNPWEHDGFKRGDTCSCIGDLMYLAVCDECRWHAIGDRENTIVEAWHDHALPGWRTLPVIPAKIRVRDERGLTKAARAWITDHYPLEWQVGGAPILTERAEHATRHVAGRSPWGGFDLAARPSDHDAP